MRRKRGSYAYYKIEDEKRKYWKALANCYMNYENKGMLYIHNRCCHLHCHANFSKYIMTGFWAKEKFLSRQ